MKEIVVTGYGYNERDDAILIKYWYQMVQSSEKNVFISATKIAKREAEKENKND